MGRYSRSLWTNTAVSLIVSAATGLMITLLCTVVFTIFTYYFMENMDFKDFFTTAALITGSYCSGFICGKFRRRRGITEGLACGVIIYLILSAAALISGSGAILGIKKLLLLSLTASAGGVVGVNSKRPKKLTSN